MSVEKVIEYFGEFKHLFFGKLHIALRLAGFGMKRAQKCILIAPFGRVIMYLVGWRRGNERKGLDDLGI